MNIIELAKEAGFEPNGSYTVLPMQDYANHGVSYQLERFAALVRAEALEEAEEIAKTIGGSFANEFLAAIRGLK